MIKSEGIIKSYSFNISRVEKILDLIEKSRKICTQENVSELINEICIFLDEIKVIEQKGEIERKETEEEAREYFGEDFINQFESLLTFLSNQKTVLALHGTLLNNCPLICEGGLECKEPSLSSTAISQTLGYSKDKAQYKNYRDLINWPHLGYKGIVIIAVPYECYYKEGLWNKFKGNNLSEYGIYDYKLDSDFIVGYVDVVGKKLVLNPKYNREHDYSSYIKDMDIFHENKEMNNELMDQILKEERKELDLLDSQVLAEENHNWNISVSDIPSIVEDLTGDFNAILKSSLDGIMNQSQYNSLLGQLNMGFCNMKPIISLLPTNEQVKKEEEARLAEFHKLSAIELSDIDAHFTDDSYWNWGEPENNDQNSKSKR